MTGNSPGVLLRLFLLLALTGSLLACTATSGSDKSRPLELKELYKTEVFDASLVTYSLDGMRLHALVATPVGAPPETGYPTIVANHGYVPVPARYGFGSDGEDRRPGDYYRAIPRLYAHYGYRVVMPDYRGHNASAGGQTLTDDIWANIGLYADDVIALVDDVVPRLPDSDAQRLYLWSHSMGGPVALQVLLNRPVFHGATFWSPMSLARWTPALDTIDVPVMIHHSRDDVTTPLTNASAFAAALEQAGVERVLFDYPGSAHLLSGDLGAQAVKRDDDRFRHGRSRTRVTTEDD